MPGKSSRTLFVVQAEPPRAREAEFHRWYDTIHGPDALANGSFIGLRRYRAAGPGRRSARFLALWEGDYENEVEAWGYIRPRAHALHAAGRVDDISSVQFALMMFLARVEGDGVWSASAACLTTVQNDWRRPDPDEPAVAWWKRVALDRAPSAPGRLYMSDPAGSGAGCFLALFPQTCSAVEAAVTWAGFGTAGSSPTPPYRTIFQNADAAATTPIDAPAPAAAWVMHWESIASLP